MTARFLAKSALVLGTLALVAGAGLAGSTPAQARVFVGFGVGPYWGGGPYWGAPYPYPYSYAYPYSYYAPPVVYSPGYAPADPDYAPAPQPAAAPPTWYYCDSPAGYYPYVQQCNGPWRPVAATPQQ